MTWGFFMQGSEFQQEIETLGAELSKQLHCPVHYPAFGKNIFECQCNITFPVFAVKAAYGSDNWTDIIKRHRGEL